ncbi:Fur family transcriptional regulator [Natranaerobius thermophilus]|uniref:Ferric uptake regulator, Fur family n=1 Tax=Natranaerobius thermophilus (strain ATCC BAA-1301 / DSM 18059 / JW/NM-WN-LF) TaxID=457570 RepID=B2A1I1_NATTJ|nr:transcriptional repressor [Natranaerobius thermophilus]ACB84721.1 ferric uptake regulator, Fur family [Natranaerobius thermophilus JW/NM-WN-LF]
MDYELDLAEIEKKFYNYKFTPQRKTILKVLFENKGHHLSAEEILQLSKEKNSDIGFATVYRTLDLFEELEIVHKLHFGDGCSRYELTRTGSSHHHHLICLNCNQIFEVKDDLLKKLENNIETQHNFKISDHRLHFYGYCKNCK